MSSEALSITLQNHEEPFRNNSPFQGPLREILIEEIYKGRILLRYYQYILLGTFLLVMIIHWINKIFWHFKQKKINYKEEADENQSLLGNISSRRTSPTYHNKICSFFMFQPKGKGMENLGITFTIIIYEIITIFFAFYQIKHWIVFAFRLGFLLTINIPLLYILGAKHSPLSFLTGWSYEQVNVLHRLVGAVCFFLLAIHLIIFAYYFRIDYLFTHLWSIAGIIAGTSFLLIGFTSGGKFRERFYEFFYIVHLIGFIISIPAIYLHYPTARVYAVIAGISFVYDRILRLFDYRLKKCYLNTASGDTVIIKIPYQGATPVKNFFHRSFSWKTGQHIYITILGCNSFESHPYTVGSSMDSEYLKLIVRARDGFSKNIYDKVKDEEEEGKREISKWCIIHGPYGVHPPEMPSNEIIPNMNTKIILVAGGAGIAYTYPLYQQYSKLNKQCDRFDINFLWVIPNRSFIEWISDEEGIDEANMDIWVTKEKGRPNISKLINEYLISNDEYINSECWVGTCGPDPLLREVRNSVANLRGQGQTNIHYYAERFGW